MPSSKQELEPGVHLWSSSVDACVEVGAALKTLSPEEHTRAWGFRFERDRVRFVARRAFLRSVLSACVGVDPAKIQIRAARSGRPELDPPGEISFNVSHSDGLAIVVVAVGRRVGVDIERIRPLADALDVAERSFTPNEVRHLRATSVESRAQAFLTIWTRKESYAKAVGAGLSMPFDRFDVMTAEPESMVPPGGSPGAGRYALTNLDSFDGYVGAVAVSVASDPIQVPLQGGV